MLAEHMNGTSLLGKLTTSLVGGVAKRDRDNLYLTVPIHRCTPAEHIEKAPH
jgi:hypothetical protein